ncbi:shikimate kinase [Geitlerinema sp. P-1104]|uniref:shikimate kinase n=1 Tax=Geitlerinema sp. P-1104 TaxID=2546230 RepID=UPI00147754EE|nr:shikimate kinase [Geitlerinema sp. P-1104]NMG59204.1 shikimate kinase [Geitlerinema sp. P-1104]
MSPKDLLQGLNIYLVGMMGSGKSTTGTHLARQIHYRYFDTDSLIEQVAGQSVREIFAQEGEASFRQLESQVLSQLSAYQRSVISTGGGIVVELSNWSFLRYGLVVWLDVAPEVLVERLQRDQSRPLLQTGDPLQTLQRLLDERRSRYEQADLRIQVNGGDSPESVSDRIIAAIPQVLKTRTSQPEDSWD